MTGSCWPMFGLACSLSTQWQPQVSIAQPSPSMPCARSLLILWWLGSILALPQVASCARTPNFAVWLPGASRPTATCAGIPMPTPPGSASWPGAGSAATDATTAPRTAISAVRTTMWSWKPDQITSPAATALACPGASTPSFGMAQAGSLSACVYGH